MAKREWSFEGARQMLPDVRKRTERAVKACEALAAQRDGLAEAAAERPEIERRMREIVERWASEMEALGLEIKGIWLVDFDNGSGYYCWKWPEPELSYFHGYADGFAGRTRIQ